MAGDCSHGQGDCSLFDGMPAFPKHERSKARALQHRLASVLENEAQWRYSQWYKGELARIRGEIEGYLDASPAYDALHGVALEACWRAGIRTFCTATGKRHHRSP